MGNSTGPGGGSLPVVSLCGLGPYKHLRADEETIATRGGGSRLMSFLAGNCTDS